MREYSNPLDPFERYEPKPPECSAVHVIYEHVDFLADYLLRYFQNVKWTKVHRSNESPALVLMIRLAVPPGYVPLAEDGLQDEMTIEVPVEWGGEYYLTRSYHNGQPWLDPTAIKYHDFRAAWRKHLG